MSELLLEADSALPLVHLSLCLGPGSADSDPPELSGITRFLLRAMRRTGGGSNAEELDRRIDLLGGSLWVDVGHGSVSLDGVILSRSFEPFCELVLDMVARPGFAPDELERLRRESESELVELLDDDRTLCRRWFARALYADHPYGRSALGTSASLARITPELIHTHYRRVIRPEQLLLGLAGDVDARRGEALLGDLRASLGGAAAAPAAVAEPTQPPGRRLLLVDKPERSQTQILIGCLGSHPADEDHFALCVANVVLGGTFSSRLTQEVRAARGWSYGAHSSLGYDRHRRAFSMWTFPKAEDAGRCIALELELLERWWHDGVSAAELEAAKRYLIRSYAFSVDTASKRLAQRVDQRLHGLPPSYYSGYREHVAAVTLEQANSAIQRRISLEHLAVCVVGTESDIGADVRAAIPDLAEAMVVPYSAEP